MILEKKKCLWGEKNCPLKKKNKKIKRENNFYERYINNHFKNRLSKIKSKSCIKCGIVINDSWFNPETSYKIFNSVYAQHHRGWKNYYEFKEKNKVNNHQGIIKKISNIIKIKKYSEFNCPFQGNFFSFLEQDQHKKNIKKLLNLTNKRIQLTQLANKPSRFFEANYKKQSKINKQIKELKNNNKSKLEKFLILDHSSSSWGDGCVSESTNCRSVAQEIFDVKMLNINEIEKKKLNFDLFSFFNTIDHTLKPKKILDFALDNSKIVLIENHSMEEVNMQHLFSIQKNFLQYLNKNKIYTFPILNQQNKFEKEKIFFLCTKSKKIEKIIKKNILILK